jgi:hypothetical protein
MTTCGEDAPQRRGESLDTAKYKIQQQEGFIFHSSDTALLKNISIIQQSDLFFTRSRLHGPGNLAK